MSETFMGRAWPFIGGSWMNPESPEPETPVHVIIMPHVRIPMPREAFYEETLAQMQRALAVIGHFEEAPSGITTHFWRRVPIHHDPARAAECRQAGGRCAYDAAVERADA